MYVYIYQLYPIYAYIHIYICIYSHCLPGRLSPRARARPPAITLYACIYSRIPPLPAFTGGGGGCEPILCVHVHTHKHPSLPAFTGGGGGCEPGDAYGYIYIHIYIYTRG